MFNRHWDTLSINIVGPLLVDQRIEYVITFVDCYSKYAILISLKNHMTHTVSNALMDRVVPYFRVPSRFLSDRGREFTGQVWEELLKALGKQRIFTSPYHLESIAINEQSQHTMNNMLRAYLYFEGTPLPRWVDKIPVILLTLNFTPHQSHR